MPMDVLYHDGNGIVGNGPTATRLLESGMDLNSLRVNASLLKDEWILLDTAVVEVARERFSAVADLLSRNMTYTVNNALGITVVQHQTMTEMIAARVSMDGLAQGQNDRVLFSLVSTPLPITHHDFQMSARLLATSRNSGQPLDTTMVREATRQVVEKIEDMVMNGLSTEETFGFGSSTAVLYGVTNYTNRNTVSLVTQWSASAATGTTILDDVIAMISAAQTDRHYGPFVLYVPTAYWLPLLEDFKANSDKTILQRIKELPMIADVKVNDKLAANTVALVEMMSSNMDLVVGFPPTPVYWETQGGMNLNFKVMAIMVPRPKADAGSRSGITILS